MVLKRLIVAVRTPAGERGVRAWLPWVALAAVTAVGCWLRLRTVEPAFLTQDGLHPTLRAIDILRREILPWRGEAVGFHFGMLQAWLMVPLAVVSGSLRQVWLVNAVVHGLGAVAICLAGRRLHGWGVGLVAAYVYSTWPILVYHPQGGAWTYHAPVLVALSLWAVTVALQRPSRWATWGLAAALATAIHMHPFALSVWLASLLLVPRLVRIQGRRRVLEAWLVAVIVLLPMLIDNAQTIFFNYPAATQVDLVEGGVRVDWALLLQTLVSLETGWPRGYFVLLYAGLVAGMIATHPRWWALRKADDGGLLVYWAVSSYAILLALASVLHYVRPPHAGPIAPIHALALVWAAAFLLESIAVRVPRWARTALVAVTCAVGIPLLAAMLLSSAGSNRPTDGLIESPPEETSLAHLTVLDRLGEAIRRDAGDDLFLLYQLVDREAFYDAQLTALHGDLFLRGVRGVHRASAMRRVETPTLAYVVVSLTSKMLRGWEGVPLPLITEYAGPGRTIAVYRFGDIADALAWLDAGCEHLLLFPDVEIQDPSFTFVTSEIMFTPAGDDLRSFYRRACEVRAENQRLRLRGLVPEEPIE